ncbi:hypothetical protein CLV98_12326 [Dyadobacter jejuensis]|uniref:Uncharacterized protein n=1 Tax=Dyadobacter jejuensis TaxID=1082580 RepID=A0A316A7G8_9BACT|nr:hypothetical protein CLV98_12326 [Dyadobacter jejuensis]
MMKYYNRNIVYAYSLYVFICTAIVFISAIITLYIVVDNYKNYERHLNRTYVYSTNGSSIEVDVNNNNN